MSSYRLTDTAVCFSNDWTLTESNNDEQIFPKNYQCKRKVTMDNCCQNNKKMTKWTNTTRFGEINKIDDFMKTTKTNKHTAR